MENINYKQHIDSIKTQIPEFKDTVKIGNDNTLKPNKFTFRIWYVYVAVPIVLMLILFIWKPNFIKCAYKDENGEEKHKINWNRYVMWVLALSALIIIPIFGYNYKYKNKQVNTAK